MGQNRGLVAAAGSQFQHAVEGVDLQAFSHQRHHVGLADGLAMPDRRRPVGKGLAAGVFGKEALAGHRPQGG